MAFAIAKINYNKTARFFVTAIKQGGLSIDNLRVEMGEEEKHVWQFRIFENIKSANRACEKLHLVGGYDDYFVVPI